MKPFAVKTQEKDLTMKQRKWLELYIQTGNATQSAMGVYDVQDVYSAGQIGHENLQKLDISALMEQMGLSDKKLMDVLTDGLNANKQIAARTGNQANAESDDFIEVEDHPTRHKFLETALKLKKRLGKEGGDTNIQVNVMPILGKRSIREEEIDGE